MSVSPSHSPSPIPSPHPARSQSELYASRANVAAFALWDWGTSAFSSVILTFVFATYLTKGVGAAGYTGEAANAASDSAASTLSITQSCAAIAIALLAPLLGALGDTGGMRNIFLRFFTLATAVITALLVFIKPDPSFVLPGAILIALAVVTSELAFVFVNSVLPQISTEENRGRVSGTAWALGYWGSILCLGIVLFGFVMPGTGLLGITGNDSWNIRAVALFVAAWIIVFTLPIMKFLPPSPRDPSAPAWTPMAGYAALARRVLRAWREEPVMLHYLVASAIYRDGLGAVFSLAGVIAAAAYGFDTMQIILFGIAANLIAGFGVYLGGKCDDALGPRRVIIASLVAVIACGLIIAVLPGALVFWIAGLALCFFVGPINASSRNLLTHLSRPDRYAEDFGLYATSGRAFGFLGTAAFAIAVSIGGTKAGIVGIVLVLALGLAAFLPLRLEKGTPARQ